jgi:hypothetical protein
LLKAAGKFFGAFDIDRFDPHGTIAEILLRDLKRQAEARPISSDGAIECVRCFLQRRIGAQPAA